MKKVFFKTMMGAGLVGVLSAGCVESIKDLYDPNYVIQQYQKNWTDSIGQIDPNQTWNTAKRIVADFDLRDVVSGDCQVNVYTANPLTPSTKLLATANVSSYGSIEFDMPSALNYVYVSVQNVPALNGYYSIQEGLVAVATRATRAGETCSVTIGDTLSLGSFHSWQVNGKVDYPGTISYLEGVTSTQASAWRYLDYEPLFSKNGYFAENTNNYELYADQWNVDGDIVYKTAEAGPVEITYSFGATQFDNMFGYFYFEDGATIDEILNSEKYILMKDATPETNFEVTGLENGFYMYDMALGNWFLYNMWEDGSFQGGDPFVAGSTYKLTYFDENGNASYDFPAGINIGFFLVTNGMTTTTNVGHQITYSMPSLNRVTGKCYTNESLGWGADYAGNVRAVTYKYGETLILGFEDNTAGGDMDMNDLVFFIGGSFEFEEEEEPEVFPVVPPTIEAQEWILACEDLGNTDDFDFNDVVFSVKYAAGSSTAFVTPLAAGGTLPANICYNGQVIGQEVHEWFGVSTSTMVNTTSRHGHAAKTVELNVADGFTMTNNMGGFTIDVNNGTSTVAAPAAGAAPQMILVSDANWAWPYERVSIVSAYSQFKDWSENASSNADWYATPTGKTVDGDYSNSSMEEGGDDITGGEEGDDETEDDVTSETHPEYGVLIAATDLVSGQPIPAKYFANVGETCTITLLSSGNINGNFYGSVSNTGMDTGWNNSGIIVITLNATLLEDAKNGALIFNSWEAVMPTVYVK